MVRSVHSLCGIAPGFALPQRSCEVVLLETITIPTGSVLTVLPGVTVKGNYLGATPYGTVGLNVVGQLQAVGTPDRPVTFTALGRGWKGIVLNSPSNTIENVYIEKAERFARASPDATDRAR